MLRGSDFGVLQDHARKLAYPNARTSGHRCIFQNGQVFVNPKIPPKKSYHHQYCSKKDATRAKRMSPLPESN
jgi:hypothetical protein